MINHEEYIKLELYLKAMFRFQLVIGNIKFFFFFFQRFLMYKLLQKGKCVEINCRYMKIKDKLHFRLLGCVLTPSLITIRY